MPRVYHLHLVSDATGETLNTVARALTVQFEGVTAKEHVYALVRNRRQLARAIKHIAANPGIVFFTLVNPELRAILESECGALRIPYVSILDQAAQALREFLGEEESHRPGGQHEVDARYMERVEAVNYAIHQDDGQGVEHLRSSEVILVGPSRTSKTPTCVYLAIRGVRAANVPIVPGVPLPEQLFEQEDKLIVGLWASPERLAQVRRNRLTTMGETRGTDYVDEASIRSEVADARRLYERHDWPAIDVTRRSIEETAANILNLLAERNEDS
jgi:[pyruvate, water dikinase]-phosphate phosphotransferase / [pyruvate, water dikinase] kinase